MHSGRGVGRTARASELLSLPLARFGQGPSVEPTRSLSVSETEVAEPAARSAELPRVRFEPVGKIRVGPANAP
jgi:hypothetical protein